MPNVVDAVPDCDRAASGSCEQDQECKVVIRRAPTEAQFSIYTGCVSRPRARGLGAPCELFGGMSELYRIDGLEDEVFVDPCEEGLYCAPDPDVRNSRSCQPACDTVFGIACSGEGEFCAGTDVFEEVCVKADGCDPRDPGSCGEGESCYLRLNDTGEAVLSVCLPVAEEPVDDGEPCQFLNDCRPGSSCWAPVRVPPQVWEMDQLICRRSCDLGLADDAGEPEDADAGALGTCSGDNTCESFAESELDISSIGVSFGQCE
jgi:hypothetical protein